jgi:Mycotoxin biosynthesis protein UstYa
MHCISLIREAIYKDQFDFTGYINTSRIEFNLHLNHCLLALKIVIECKADSGPILLEELEEESDTSSKDVKVSAWRLQYPPKQCRRFEPLRNWYEANTICSSFCGAPEIYSGKHGNHEHRGVGES